MNFYEYIGSQFSNPRGITGKLCCLLMNLMNRSMYNGVVDSLYINPRSSVLDIGYGNGYLIKRLDQKSGAHLYGIDISADARRSAYKRNKKGVLDHRVHLSIGDCCNLKFKNNMFHAVTSVNTIYFWEDTSKGLAEIYRVLKKGGTFSNALYSRAFLARLKYTQKGFQFFEPQDIKKLAKKAGFSKISIKKISHGRGYLVNCQK